jgi:transposase
MNPGPHRRYTLDFKLQAVKAALDARGSLKSSARQLGISHSLLLFWLEKYRQGALTEEDNLLEKVRDYEAQIATLERKVGQLTMEIERLRGPVASCPTEHPPTEPTDPESAA